MDAKQQRDWALELLKTRRTIVIQGKLETEPEDIILECLMTAQVNGYKEITVIFNSGGGNWSTGLAIYNTILLCVAAGMKVRGIVISRCSSAAAAIFQACSSREMLRGTCILMHWGRSSLCNAEQAALRKGEAEWVIRQINDSNEEMLAILNSRANIDLKALAVMCDNEERIFSARAMELGLADKVLDVQSLHLEDFMRIS